MRREIAQRGRVGLQQVGDGDLGQGRTRSLIGGGQGLGHLTGDVLAHRTALGPGASGGSWLLRQPETICLDEVLKAVNGCAHLGSTPAGAKGCPVGEHIPRQVAKALTAADQAAGAALSKITIADLLAEDPEVLRPFAPHPCCPNADAA